MPEHIDVQEPMPTEDGSARMRPLKDMPVPAWFFATTVVSVCLIAVAVLTAFVSSPVEARSHSTVTRSVDMFHEVTFAADFRGGAYDEASSRIPLWIRGRSLGGVPYDMTIYPARKGADVRLPLGSYDISVLASPIASDGTVYEVPKNVVHIEMDESMGASESVIVSESDAFVFNPVPADELTDEQVADALRWVVRDPDPAVDAEALERAVEERRSAARG